MTLTTLRDNVRQSVTLEDTVRLLSLHVQDKTQHCDTPCRLIAGPQYGGVECVGSERKKVYPFVSLVEYDDPLSTIYVRLQTMDKCDLAFVGLAEFETFVEITSDTVPSQRRKHYNTLLRTVAVILAFKMHKPIKSTVTNAWSAYTLLKDYQTTVRLKQTQEKHVFMTPLSKDDAYDLKARCGEVYVRPTVDNLQYATRLFDDATVKCSK